MKNIVIPNSFNLIEKLIDKCDGFIIGVDGFSVNLPVSFSVEDIKHICDICTNNSKELFVVVNKNIHNNELDNLTELLKLLAHLNISGIMYYDVAIVNLNRKLKLNLNLIWHQEHLSTNYVTCNFWASFGVGGAYLSSDITLDEILTIKKNLSIKTFVNVFGYLPMFVSYRHLVKNYLNTFHLKDNSSKYKISKEGKDYYIVDNSLGSFVYSSNILSALEESLILREHNIDYIVLNSFNISDEKFIEVVNLFTNLNHINVNDFSNRIAVLFDNIDKGFLYKETVYKVKNNE